MMLFFKKKTEKQKTGIKGERLAARYLEEKGYTLLARNYRHGRGEIDIIASHSGELVFIEVKSTASDSAEEFKMPCEAVDRKKRDSLRACALGFIGEKKRHFESYRFDVVEVYLNREKPEINHIKNAFYIKERTY